MCGLFRTAQPLEEGLLGPSAVRNGAEGFMLEGWRGGNGEKRMSASDPKADIEAESTPITRGIQGQLQSLKAWRAVGIDKGRCGVSQADGSHCA